MAAERSAKIRKTFNGLNKDTMYLIDEFYAPEIVFEDPLHRIEGRAKLTDYYKGLYRSVRSIHFDIFDEVVQGDKHVIFWKMRLEAPGLNGGKPYMTSGSSLIHFNAQDMVAFHRDYFDMGEFIYEQIPVLKNLIKAIRTRLTN